MARCKGKVKSTGKQCKKNAAYGTNYCRSHGGAMIATANGANNPAYKHGRYSKAFRDAARAERFQEHRLSEDALAHRDQLALLDMMVEDAIGAIDQDAGASERLWGSMAKLLVDFEVAIKNKDSRKQTDAFVRMKEVAGRGLQDASAREELRRLVQERSAVADRETARIAKMEKLMTYHDVKQLFDAVWDEARKAITESDKKLQFERAMQRLAGA